MAKNIIFPGPGIIWRVHWKLVQLGAFPAVRLNTYPSLGDGEQLCLLKCKFSLATAAATGEPRLGCSRGKEGG